MIQTIKIKHPKQPGQYMLINASDYNPAQHTLFEDKTPPPAPPVTGPAPTDKTDATAQAAAAAAAKAVEEMRAMVLLLDETLETPAGLKNITDPKKYDDEKLDELGSVLEAPRGEKEPADKYRQRLFEVTTKLLA